MSQAGVANIGAIPPPPGSLTDLQGQDGVTVPPNGAGIIFVHGAVVAAGTTPFTTTGNAGTNTETWNIQISQAIAATDATKIGLAAFNSAQFTVDANGFVSTSGTGVGNTITGNSGGALSPTAGNWNIFGAAVAAGTTPVATAGAVSTLTVNVQRSQAIGATNASNVGLAAFDSAKFTVDGNGFVSTVGTAFIGSVAVDANTAPGTNPVLPNASGQITVTGGQVAAGTTTNVIRTDSLAANTYTVQIQRSQAVASSTVGDNGVSHFNSANFSVDSNGFVSALAQAFNYTSVNAAASPYTVLSTDYYISVDSSGGAVTLNFPNAPTFKQVWIVKDRTGSAATNNITLTTPGGTVTFDGSTTFVMNSNYQANQLIANSTPTYEIY